jgi:hypothetical protein
MSIGALDPVLASALAKTRQTTAAETAPDASAAETSDAQSAKAAEAVAGTGMTGSTAGQLCTKNKTVLLSFQEDQPPLQLKSIRQTLFEQFDTDKNGAIDDAEWQHYLDWDHKLMDNGHPLDFRDYDPATDTKPDAPGTIVHVSLDGITQHHDA